MWRELSVIAVLQAAMVAPAFAAEPSVVEGYWRGEVLLNGDRMPADLEVRGDGAKLFLPDLVWAAEVEARATASGISVEFPFGLGRQELESLGGRVLASAGTPATTLRRTAAPGYRREAVLVPSPAGPLKARLYVPAGDRPRPAVVIAGGATQGAHDNPGLDAWCDFYVRRGLVCLTTDRRPEAAPESPPSDLAADAEDLAAAVELVRGRPETDPKRVGLFGISRGAWPALRVAADDPSVRFLVLSAPSASSPGEAEVVHVEARMRRDGVADAQIRAALDYYRLYMDAARRPALWPRLNAAARAAEKEPWGKYVDQPLKPEHMTFWRRNADFSNAADFRRLRTPVLAVWGADDVIVPPAAHRPVLQERLAAVPLETAVYPAANHPIETQPGPDRLGVWRWPTRGAGLLAKLETWLGEQVGTQPAAD